MLFLGLVTDLQTPAPPTSCAALLRKPAPKMTARQILSDAEAAIAGGIERGFE